MRISDWSSDVCSSDLPHEREMTTMRATDEQQKVARAFVSARAEKTPLTVYPGPMPRTMADAYAIQDAAIALDGRRIGGWKVGRIAPDLVDHYGGDRLIGPIFADEIVDARDGHVPAMGVYPGGFAAAEAEVLLRFADVGARHSNIRYEESPVGKECVSKCSYRGTP